MTTTDTSSTKPTNNTRSMEQKAPQIEEIGFELNKEIDLLEESIFASASIPFLRKTLVDEDNIANQLDLIRANIPDCIAQSLTILAQKEQIMREAQAYAQKMVENAQRKAAQILDDSRIVQQAEAQANQIRRQVQQDCEALQRKTVNDVDQMRQRIQQEALKTRQQSILEAEDIQNEADSYADMMLSRLEKQLTEMLRVVTNGRQQIKYSPPANQHKGYKRSSDMLINKKAS